MLLYRGIIVTSTICVVLQNINLDIEKGYKLRMAQNIPKPIKILPVQNSSFLSCCRNPSECLVRLFLFDINYSHSLYLLIPPKSFEPPISIYLIESVFSPLECTSAVEQYSKSGVFVFLFWFLQHRLLPPPRGTPLMVRMKRRNPNPVYPLHDT